MKRLKYIYWDDKFVWAKLEKDGSIILYKNLFDGLIWGIHKTPFKFEQEAIKDAYFK